MGERLGRQRISILSAPSNLGLKPPSPGVEPGVRLLPAALLRQGLLARLDAVDAGVVTPPAYDAARDPQTGIRNAAALRRYSVELADRIGELLALRWHHIDFDAALLRVEQRVRVQRRQLPGRNHAFEQLLRRRILNR